MNKLLSLVIALHVSTLNLKSVSHEMFPQKLQFPETNWIIAKKTFNRKILQRETPSSFLYQENILPSTVLRRNLTDTLIGCQYSWKHTKLKITASFQQKKDI